MVLLIVIQSWNIEYCAGKVHHTHHHHMHCNRNWNIDSHFRCRISNIMYQVVVMRSSLLITSDTTDWCWVKGAEHLTPWTRSHWVHWSNNQTLVSAPIQRHTQGVEQVQCSMIALQTKSHVEKSSVRNERDHETNLSCTSSNKWTFPWLCGLKESFVRGYIIGCWPSW